MVWTYVELKAHDILCEIKHPDFYWLRVSVCLRTRRLLH
jgi:hypothetical protein